MSFQNNLCDLRVLGGEYVTAIPARPLTAAYRIWLVSKPGIRRTAFS
jgi:hypothetical protein